MMNPIAQWRTRDNYYRLQGVTCTSCHKKFFPKKHLCVCGGSTFENYTFSGEGILKTFTQITVSPTVFKDAVPYCVGIVELAEGPRIIAPLTDVALDDLSIDMPVVAVFRRYCSNGEKGIISYFDQDWPAGTSMSGEKTYGCKFIKPIKRVMDELGYPYRIFGRPKSIFSIYNKIKTKSVSFEEIYDLFAVRIVLDVPRNKEKAACWQVYSEVTDVFKPIPERLKDWITTPKSNGYESLHTTVIGPEGKFVEVQLRTERMDEIAERGFAAHWKYKGITNQPDVYDTWLDSIREIMDNPNSDALEFISDFKNNLYAEEIFVVTPMGDMINMPKGSTALDFAFHIHTDVGYHCKAVKVNNSSQWSDESVYSKRQLLD